MDETTDKPLQQRRATDKGLLCAAALRASQFWDWIDARDIDKHAVSVAVLYGTVTITTWSMQYAAQSARPGLEVAAIIGAVSAPYMALQAAAISFYFKSRSN